MNANSPIIQNLEKSLPHDALGDLRLEALYAFIKQGLPHRKIENWKYTDLQRLLTGQSFNAEDMGLPAKVIENSGLETHKIYFCDGKMDLIKTDLSNLPQGLSIQSLFQNVAQLPKNVLQKLQGYEDYSEQALLALNTALMSDGAIILLADSVQIKKPIELIYQCSGIANGKMHNYRNVVLIGEHSQLCILETVQAPGKCTNLVNTVTQIEIGHASSLQHFVMQSTLTKLTHICNVQVEQQKNSRVYAFNAALNTEISRYDFHSKLKESGAECIMDGIYILNDKQHADSHTLVEHLASQTKSDQVYQGIIDNFAHGVFNGKVLAEKNVKGIVAHQLNKNILLGKTAAVDTKPELLILTDDVQCTHGATVGQLDEEALFYLQSRGIPKNEAKSLLIQAFTTQSLIRIKEPAIAAWLTELIAVKMKSDKPLIKI